LQVTLEKIERNWGAEPYLQVEELLDMVKKQAEKSCITSIPHKIGDRVLLIKTEVITYFKANEKYVEFFTTQGEKYLTELSLKKLLERLPDNFVQVHRGTIVNTDHIKECRKYFKGKYVLIFDDLNSTRVETGRSFSATLKKIIYID
jgi:two-component system, LytTR family, response regulator